MKKFVCIIVASIAAAGVKAQTPELYVDMGGAEAFDGVSCIIEETAEEGNKVWNISLTNTADCAFMPQKVSLRLGIDTYMDRYPEWLDKYFPTMLYCCRTHFYGYMQTPSGKMLGIVSPDPVASWSMDYNMAYEEPEGFWFYGHRIRSVNLDLLNALPLPVHNPQDRWKIEPGAALKWKIIFTEIDSFPEFEKRVHEVSGVPVLKIDQTSYTAGQSAGFEVFGDKPEITVTDISGRRIAVKRKRLSDRWTVACRLDEPGLYNIEVRDGGFETTGCIAVHKPWEWIMRKAREGALKHRQKATSHVESWYGYHTAFLAARHFPEPAIDSVMANRFDRQMKALYGENLHKPLYYEWRIQNTSSTIGMYVDKFEAYGDEEDLKTACRLADWLIGYAQKKDDAYRNKWNTIYTSVIYVAKSILELYMAEKRYADSAECDKVFWTEAAGRHYDSARRAIDQLVAARGDFHTEGEITFEDGMIACSALQIGLLALLQEDSTARKHYADAMLPLLESHGCLASLRVPDAKRRGGTMRWWEAQYDVHMMPNMFSSPHGWSAWRAYATYYAYLLTGEEKWLMETWNAMGAFSNLIDNRTGELRWAFVLDPYIRARQISEPVKASGPDSLDFGNPHPDMYRTEEFIFGESYVPMVSSWQECNSQDNDVHEVFKFLEEVFLTNAFVVERQTGEIAGYNCRVHVKGNRITVIPDESHIVNLHVNMEHGCNIVFNGKEIPVEGGCRGFVIRHI